MGSRLGAAGPAQLPPPRAPSWAGGVPLLGTWHRPHPGDLGQALVSQEAGGLQRSPGACRPGLQANTTVHPSPPERSTPHHPLLSSSPVQEGPWHWQKARDSDKPRPQTTLQDVFYSALHTGLPRLHQASPQCCSLGRGAFLGLWQPGPGMGTAAPKASAQSLGLCALTLGGCGQPNLPGQCPWREGQATAPRGSHCHPAWQAHHSTGCLVKGGSDLGPSQQYGCRAAGQWGCTGPRRCLWANGVPGPPQRHPGTEGRVLAQAPLRAVDTPLTRGTWRWRWGSTAHPRWPPSPTFLGGYCLGPRQHEAPSPPAGRHWSCPPRQN